MSLACRLSGLLLAAVLSAQQPSPLVQLEARLLPEVTAKLVSESARDVAWGGYLAQRFQLADAAPVLREALQQWRDRDGDDARIVRLHLIDALWTVATAVPPAEIAFLLDDELTRVAAFLILARDVKKNAKAIGAVAMGPAGSSDDVTRIAAAAMLIDHRVQIPGLAAHLLPHTAYGLTILVRDDDASPPWSEAVGLGGGGGMLRKPRGFPPLVQHQLIEDSWAVPPDGELRVVRHGTGGDCTVWHKREEVAVLELRPLFVGERSPAPEPDDVMPWLARMADVKQSRDTLVRLRWKGADQLRIDAAKAQQDLRGRLDHLVARLRAEGWLRPDELDGFRIPFHTRVEDQRIDKQEPLPEIQGESR